MRREPTCSYLWRECSGRRGLGLSLMGERSQGMRWHRSKLRLLRLHGRVLQTSCPLGRAWPRPLCRPAGCFISTASCSGQSAKETQDPSPPGSRLESPVALPLSSSGRGRSPFPTFIEPGPALHVLVLADQGRMGPPQSQGPQCCRPLAFRTGRGTGQVGPSGRGCPPAPSLPEIWLLIYAALDDQCGDRALKPRG